jgi:hypothetical protein
LAKKVDWSAFGGPAERYDFSPFNSLAVDVDGTLVFWDGFPDKPGKARGKPTPNEPLVAALIRWKRGRPDRHLTVWSKGGIEHVRRICALCRLTPYVDVMLEKPNLLVDDSTNWMATCSSWLRVHRDRKPKFVRGVV